MWLSDFDYDIDDSIPASVFNVNVLQRVSGSSDHLPLSVIYCWCVIKPVHHSHIRDRTSYDIINWLHWFEWDVNASSEQREWIMEGSDILLKKNCLHGGYYAETKSSSQSWMKKELKYNNIINSDCVSDFYYLMMTQQKIYLFDLYIILISLLGFSLSFYLFYISSFFCTFHSLVLVPRLSIVCTLIGWQMEKLFKYHRIVSVAMVWWVERIGNWDWRREVRVD